MPRLPFFSLPSVDPSLFFGQYFVPLFSDFLHSISPFFLSLSFLIFDFSFFLNYFLLKILSSLYPFTSTSFFNFFLSLYLFLLFFILLYFSLIYFLPLFLLFIIRLFLLPHMFTFFYNFCLFFFFFSLLVFLLFCLISLFLFLFPFSFSLHSFFNFSFLLDFGFFSLFILPQNIRLITKRSRRTREKIYSTLK